MNRQEQKDRLSKAVDEFVSVMKARLYEKVDVDFTGWDNPAEISDAVLREAISNDIKLPSHMNKEADIANRAMMLWWRKWLEL